MEPEKILRISELSRLSRERALTEAEQAEREELRREYIQGFRESAEQTLDRVRVREADGTLRPLRKKDGSGDDNAPATAYSAAAEADPAKCECSQQKDDTTRPRENQP